LTEKNLDEMNILVVNGEQYWDLYFPNDDVHYRKIQDLSWLLKEGQLYALSTEGALKVDALLWRLGAIRPNPKHFEALNILALANLPQVNTASCLRLGYDRLSMLHQLQIAKIKTVPFQVVSDSRLVNNIKRPYPFVLKQGNYHGGYGKVLVQHEEQWADIKDLLFTTNDYISIEAFINYKRDIRYLYIDGKIRAMARQGKSWKANTETISFELIATESQQIEETTRLAQQIGADILAIDYLETEEGELLAVEYNDIPGLSGFPEACKAELANCLIQKIKKDESQSSNAT
jgi:ribosomal protein S6--L-glutamate ligase